MLNQKHFLRFTREAHKNLTNLVSVNALEWSPEVSAQKEQTGLGDLNNCTKGCAGRKNRHKKD